MKKTLRFIIDILTFGLLFLSLLKYLDEFDFNKPITFFVTTLIICYVMYRYELSFIDKGTPKMKNPPKTPKKRKRPDTSSDFNL